MEDDSILSSSERICAECGRKFGIWSMELWAYKLIVKGRTLWFCRYNCVRAGEKKLQDAKTGRMKDMKSKKPSKNALETDLRAGLSISAIAKIYDASSQSVNNWIKSYGLAGIQGKPKTEEIIQHAPPVNIVQESPTLIQIEQFDTDEPVQELPKAEMHSPVNIPGQGLAELENLSGEEFDRIMSMVEVKFVEPSIESTTAESKSTEDPVPESVTSSDPVPAPPFAEVWQNALEDLSALKGSYVTLAQKEFKDRLLEMVTYLAG